MPSATIKIYLPHGDPKRLRTGEISNWSGKAVAGPRTELEQILARDETSSAGVYILSGTDPFTGNPAVYIGEAETIRDRLKQHLSKDFWSQLVFFTSKDENLTKAHVRFLESRLIVLAKEARRFDLTNSQASNSKLPESDVADMEIFLERIEQLLPALGVDVLVPVTSRAAGASETQLLYCEISGLKATARLTPNGIVVLSGSQAAATLRPSAADYPWIVKSREQLLKDGVLTHHDNALVFQQDHEFSSPSAAATIVHGGTANGRTAWKDGAGKTLKALESA
ncbi:MAG: GIY-YIG nuclease family protein [Luteimonas sp.]|nr:GIY-YIG nuclease family protein [Luteimonas sp.]